MSNRFHNKWHRTNHHTYTNVNNPDAGHDPIASQSQPFLGEFVLSGALSAVAPLSAYAAHFYSNNTAICAIAGYRGIYVTGSTVGIEAFSNKLAISAYSPIMGFFVYSPLTALEAIGQQVAGIFQSPTICLSSGGGGYNVFNSRTGIYTVPTSRNILGNSYYPVLDVKGDSYFDGTLTITGNLSTLGSISYLDTRVVITSSMYVENKGTDAAVTVIQQGDQPILVCYDRDVSLGTPSLIVDGAKGGYVGLNVVSPTERLTVNGNISGTNLKISLNQGLATGDYSAAFNTASATGNNSFAIGFKTLASGDCSYAEGNYTSASGYASHAEGNYTSASGYASHAEGEGTKAVGFGSHAEGTTTIAFGNYSHTENVETSAIGFASHAGGIRTQALGNTSHAVGYRATAAHSYTYAWSDGNLGTVTANVSTTRIGQYMVSASGGVFIPGSVGIGTDDLSKKLSVIGYTYLTSLTADDTYLWNLTATNAFVFNLTGLNTYIKDLSVDTANIKSLTANNAYITNSLSAGNISVYYQLSANDTYLNSLTLPVSNLGNNSTSITFDFTKNSYVYCPITTTPVNLYFASMQPGKTLKIYLSSGLGSDAVLNPDSRYIYAGYYGRPTTLPRFKTGLFVAESFGYTLSSVIITYFPQN